MLDSNQSPSLEGQDIRDSGGEKVGRVDHVYVDGHTGMAAWAALDTGLLGADQSVVPLGPAEFYQDHIQLPFSRKVVEEAPDIGPIGEHLSPEQEARLNQHFGLRGDESVSDFNATTDVDLDG
ncbi:PRC-barrel domain-containing protein [Knoellia sp. CPCC 206450]|uniref:PRC-barrel domain-containing protein n=1 Tax=Knoellia tibetensis TaxID=3404798 RepID=UPI003B436048